MIKGIAASKGIGIGNAVLIKETDNKSQYEDKKIPDTECENEVKRFKDALAATEMHMEEVSEKARNMLGEAEMQVFEAYKMVLNDPIFTDMVVEIIKNELLCAEGSVLKSVDKIKLMFASIDNDYMRQRAEDIQNVGKSIISSLTGNSTVDLSCLYEDSIIIAEDLTPADTVSLDRKHVKGFAIEKGGETSHTAILARTLEIPALVGCGQEIKQIANGKMVIIDGQKGVLISSPTSEELQRYLQKQSEYFKEQEKVKVLKDEYAVTIDGRRVNLAGNIAKPEEALDVLDKGGDGVGLFRTEFLYLNREKLPSEDEQFEAYRKAAEAIGNRPCIIRTLDIGGDKKSAFLNLPEEENPFLGYRAIRVCLAEKEIFKTQLSAILRASAFGNVKIMFPMISCLEELREAKQILNETMAELDGRGVQFNRDIQIGIMIEVPSAAMASDILAREADFFSIGTNDLCQYTLAVDRMNERISSLYNPLNIGVLRLIKKVIDSAHEKGIEIGMCGEMASNAENAILLLGLGLDEFSMAPASIPYVKQAIRNTSFEKAVSIAEKALALDESEKIINLLKEEAYAY